MKFKYPRRNEVKWKNVIVKNLNKSMYYCCYYLLFYQFSILILELFILLVFLHLILSVVDHIIILILKKRSFSTTSFSMLNVRWFSGRFFMLFLWEWIIKTRTWGRRSIIFLQIWSGNNCSIKIRFIIWLNFMFLMECVCIQVCMLSL